MARSDDVVAGQQLDFGDVRFEGALHRHVGKSGSLLTEFGKQRTCRIEVAQPDFGAELIAEGIREQSPRTCRLCGRDYFRLKASSTSIEPETLVEDRHVAGHHRALVHISGALEGVDGVLSQSHGTCEIGIDRHQQVHRIADAVEVTCGPAGFECSSRGRARFVVTACHQVDESVYPARAAEPRDVAKLLEQCDCPARCRQRVVVIPDSRLRLGQQSEAGCHEGTVVDFLGRLYGTGRLGECAPVIASHMESDAAVDRANLERRRTVDASQCAHRIDIGGRIIHSGERKPRFRAKVVQIETSLRVQVAVVEQGRYALDDLGVPARARERFDRRAFVGRRQRPPTAATRAGFTRFSHPRLFRMRSSRAHRR